MTGAGSIPRSSVNTEATPIALGKNAFGFWLRLQSGRVQ
jgi:hypothetical protein